MAQLGFSLNREELPVSESNFEPLPEGWYTTQITGAELKDTKSGSGQYIKVEHTVIGENFAGRKVWGMLNIRNDNEKAEEIGRQQLGALMSAIGLKAIEDTDQLVGSDVAIKLKIRPAKDGYDASNNVTGYKAVEGGTKPAEMKKEAAPPWAK